MKKKFSLIAIIIIACSINLQSQKAKKLFNGENLKGWYAYEPKTGVHKDATKVFEVSDKMIRFHGKKIGYLMSEQGYNNFKLTIEYRWNTDTTFVKRSKKKNSGIMYMVPVEYTDTIWPKGIQFQVKEGSTGDFILLKDVTLKVKNTETIAGKSVVSKRFVDAANAIGEWNTIEIIAKKGKITQKLNGKIVNEGENPSIWGGRILIQYEGYPIDYRKVEIKEL